MLYKPTELAGTAFLMANHISKKEVQEMRKIASFLTSAAVLAASLTVFTAGAGAEETADKGVVILHTNDVHCGFQADDNTYGAADLAAYKARLEDEGYDVILVDAGDFVQGGVIGTLSDGEFPMQIMNELGYDAAVPGNHEFDYGMDAFFKLTDEAEFPYLSVNFTDLRTGEKPFQPYSIIEADQYKIAFIGLTTPETPLSSRPTNFMDENGEFIYGFLGGDDGTALYTAVQDAIDAAYADGADFVFALGHMGDYAYDDRWSSISVFEHVSGLTGFIDGHSHSEIVAEGWGKDGGDVWLTSTGSKLQTIGQITITPDRLVNCELICKGDYTVSTDENSAEYKAYQHMSDFIAGIEDQYNELAGTVVAKTNVELTVNDPDTGERAVRSAETNLGDLCADAYRAKTSADIALINGGGVRANIAAGDITYGNIIDVQPFGNSLCVVKATGQQILDCLEMGAMYAPEENGGFMQVSGLSYTVNSYIPSSVSTDENGNFVGVDGEYRVQNVVIKGEPLDLDRTYTLASHDYLLLSGGDGMSMFKDCTVVAKEITLDYQALIDFITEDLGGTVGEEYSDPRGSGRITIVSEVPATAESAETSESAESTEAPETAEADGGTGTAADEHKGSPDTGVGSVAVFVSVVGLSAALMAASRRRK